MEVREAWDQGDLQSPALGTPAVNLCSCVGIWSWCRLSCLSFSKEAEKWIMGIRSPQFLSIDHFLFLKNKKKIKGIYHW